MSEFDVDIDDFSKLVEPLIGLPISKPWRGYGSSIFFELGELTPRLTSREKRRKTSFVGQASIWVNWDWRVGNGARVIFGSSDSGPEIADGMKEHQSLTICSIVLNKELLEITVGFSNGNFLKSMTMTKGYPQWSIKLSDGKYLSVKNGQLSGDPIFDEISDEESIASDISEETVKRWDIPTEIGGEYLCGDCRNFMRIDGNFYFLDYGVCISEQGPFDGRAVSCKSTCAKYEHQASRTVKETNNS